MPCCVLEIAAPPGGGAALEQRVRGRQETRRAAAAAADVRGLRTSVPNNWNVVSDYLTADVDLRQ